MSEGDFTGMDAGEYYAMRDFEDRERAGSQEAGLIRRVHNQRTEINGLKNRAGIISGGIINRRTQHFPRRPHGWSRRARVPTTRDMCATMISQRPAFARSASKSTCSG